MQSLPNSIMCSTRCTEFLPKYTADANGIRSAPSPGPCPPENCPHHKPALSTNFHRLTDPTFFTLHAAVSTAASSPTVLHQLSGNHGCHHMGLRLYFYQLIVHKCYGCGSNFVDKYRYSPYNQLSIKQINRMIAGKDSLGQLQYSVEFNNTCYHL